MIITGDVVYRRRCRRLEVRYIPIISRKHLSKLNHPTVLHNVVRPKSARRQNYQGILGTLDADNILVYMLLTRLIHEKLIPNYTQQDPFRTYTMFFLQILSTFVWSNVGHKRDLCSHAHTFLECSYITALR